MLNLKRHVLRLFWCTAIVGRACRALRRLLSKPSNELLLLLLLLSILRLLSIGGKTYAKIISKEIYLRILFSLFVHKRRLVRLFSEVQRLRTRNAGDRVGCSAQFFKLGFNFFFKTIVEATKELNVIKQI